MAGVKRTKPLIPARRGIVAITADAQGVHCCIRQPHCNVKATIRVRGVRHEAEILRLWPRSSIIVINRR